MSEFIEIGKMVCRVSDVMRAKPYGDRTVVDFVNYGADTFDEPYESVRDKLMGKPVKADRTEDFVRQISAFFHRQNMHEVAASIRTFYDSMMLSETEGAG